MLMGYVTYDIGGSNPTLFLNLSIINIFVLLYGNSLNIHGPAEKPDDF
jgi:hypothetical protein